jgi:hypothetical protein
LAQIGRNDVQFSGLTFGAKSGATNPLALRVRTHLCQIAGQGTAITYQALAKALNLSPPNTIHQLTLALECLMAEDTAAAHPMIAALVISRARGGLPALGFFDCAQRLGRYNSDPSGPDASAFYTTEFNAAVKFWRQAPKVVK